MSSRFGSCRLIGGDLEDQEAELIRRFSESKGLRLNAPECNGQRKEDVRGPFEPI